jgi:hypothetical protein
MEESYAAKKALCTKPERSEDRRRERPKLILCNKLKEDVGRVGCRHLRINTRLREDWRELVEDDR